MKNLSYCCIKVEWMLINIIYNIAIFIYSQSTMLLNTLSKLFFAISTRIYFFGKTPRSLCILHPLLLLRCITYISNFKLPQLHIHTKHVHTQQYLLLLCWLILVHTYQKYGLTVDRVRLRYKQDVLFRYGAIHKLCRLKIDNF